MIAYDLTCSRGHTFEAWFKDLESFEKQREKGLIECPRCGTSETAIAYRTAHIRKGGLKGGSAAALKAARQIEDFLSEHFEDVGDRFADEARKLHHGEGEPRNIHGETTAEEEKALREEGVTFFKIALPKPPH